LYKLEDNGRRLELVHRTPVGGIPGALQAFKGRLLAGCGPVLRIYDKGKKKLLRKCEHRKLPVHIASIETFGDRIFVADSQVGLCHDGLMLPVGASAGVWAAERRQACACRRCPSCCSLAYCFLLLLWHAL
jgi:hypothetical protein